MSDEIAQRRLDCHSKSQHGVKSCLHDLASHAVVYTSSGIPMRGDCLCSGCDCKGFVSREGCEAAEAQAKRMVLHKDGSISLYY